MARANLGINFGGDFVAGGTFPNATATADLAYLRSKVNYLRTSIPAYTNSTGNANARAVSLAAKALGFNVLHGICTPSSTTRQANWSTYTTAVLAEATWAQANSIDAFAIGNEEELHAQTSLSSLTSSGTTATATFSSAHNFVDQSTVTISLAANANYNGTFTITVTSSTTFTYVMPGSATTPDTGTARAQDITKAQMGTKIRALATNVKTVFFGTVTYSALQGSFDDYITNGKGDLDIMSLNNYGSVGGTTDYENNIKLLQGAFGASFWLTEFNLDNSWTRITDTDANVARRVMERLAINTKYGIRSYFYAWKTGNGDFAAKFSNGDYRLLWPYLIGERPVFTGIPNVAVTRASSVSRGASSNRVASTARGVL